MPKNTYENIISFISQTLVKILRSKTKANAEKLNGLTHHNMRFTCNVNNKALSRDGPFSISLLCSSRQWKVEGHDGAQPPNKSSSQPVFIITVRKPSFHIYPMNPAKWNISFWLFSMHTATKLTLAQHKQVHEIKGKLHIKHHCIYLRKRYHTGVWIVLQSCWLMN